MFHRCGGKLNGSEKIKKGGKKRGKKKGSQTQSCATLKFDSSLLLLFSCAEISRLLICLSPSFSFLLLSLYTQTQRLSEGISKENSSKKKKNKLRRQKCFLLLLPFSIFPLCPRQQMQRHFLTQL